MRGMTDAEIDHRWSHCVSCGERPPSPIRYATADGAHCPPDDARCAARRRRKLFRVLDGGLSQGSAAA